MPSVSVSVPQGVWTNITNGKSNGSIYHKSGTSHVSYIESISAPTGSTSENPIYQQTYLGGGFSFNSVLPGEDVYVFVENADAEIVVTGV